jgi:hypothetical protein
MNTATAQTEIYFQTDKNGTPLAFRWSRRQFRSFRVSMDKAFMMVATGEAKVITAPLKKF